MICNNFIKAQITIIVIAILCGCSPNSVPITDGPVLIPNSTAPVASVITSSTAMPVTVSPVSIPNTITPVAGVISSSADKNVVLLNTISVHSKRVLDVTFSAQGEFLVSSSQDMNITVWDVKSRQEVHTFKMKSVDMADIDVSSRNMLASGEAIWDLESMQEIYVLERGSQFPASVAFSPDGSLLALGLFEQQITLWDVASGQPVYTFDKQEENRTKRMEFSPDGALLAVGVINGTVRLLDVASGKIIHILRNGGETDIHGLAFSPDGNYLASGGRVPAVILWNVAGGEVVRQFSLTDNAISMDFSPDGTILATAGGYKYEVRLWDVESGNLLYSLPHNDQLTSVAFSPDGKLLAVGCFDNNIYLWGISTNP